MSPFPPAWTITAASKTYSDEKSRIGRNRDSGGRRAHAAASPRPPISTSIVVRTESYTYAAKVWALSLVQGPFSVASSPNPSVAIRNVFHRRDAVYPPPPCDSTLMSQPQLFRTVSDNIT
jgi:hypothetical protein